MSPPAEPRGPGPGGLRDPTGVRLFQLYVEITEERIFAWVADEPDEGNRAPFSGTAPSTGDTFDPWGSSPSGNWFLTSGSGDDPDLAWLDFPPGFGLSDLQVSFWEEGEASPSSLPYSGTLDHLLRPIRDDDLVPPRVLRQMEDVFLLRRIAGELEAASLTAMAGPF